MSQIAAILPSRTLQADHLTCMRGGQLVFSDMNLVGDPGTLILLRGPNGVGKSSLLLCLAGLIRPKSGAITWQGRDSDAEPDSDIHFIGHKPAVKPGLTLIENLEFWADMLGGARQMILPALEKAGIAHAARLDAAYLSAGQTRRLALARLLIAPRPIWLLDEPTSALDADGERWVAGLIADQVEAGGLVIAATHLDLPLPETVKTKTIMMERGQ